MNSNNNNYINQLPIDLLKIIFDNLPGTNQRIICQSVCVSWKIAARLSMFSRTMFQNEKMELRNKKEMEFMEKYTRVGGASPDELRMVKTLTIGSLSTPLDQKTPMVLNIAARQLFVRLPFLEELIINDCTVSLRSFIDSNIPAQIATNCPRIQRFIVNNKMLTDRETCAAYLGALKSMHMVLSDVVLPNGDFSPYGDAVNFLSDFYNLTKLDVRGVTYFSENQDRVQLLLNQRPGLVVLYDSSEQ